MKLKKTLRAIRLMAIGLFSLLAISSQAGTYTWTGATSGTWGADATNWTSSIAGVPGVNDTAVIGDSSTNQTILLTSAATSGTIAGLNFTRTTSGTTTLQIIRPGSSGASASLSVSGTGFTLGGGNPLAVTQLYLDPSLNQSAAGVSGTNIYLGVNNVTLAVGGILKFGAYVYLSGGTYYANSSTISGTVNIAGGSLLMPNAVNVTGSGPGSYTNTIGALTMSSGTLSIGDGNAAVSNRLGVNGNFNVSGGTIYVGTNDQISLSGVTNVISGSATLNSGASLMLFANNATFSSSTYVGSLAARGSGTATISSSGTGTQFGSLAFGVSGSNGVATIKLGTNLTTGNVTAGYGVSTGSSATTVNYVTDLNNNTLSITGGAFQPGSVYSNSANWYLGNTGTGTGTIIAGSYNFTTANIQTNVGLNSVGTVVLTATGNNVTSYLGTSGTIAPNTTFLYAGGTGATLNSGRQIGRLAVGDGTVATGTSSLGLMGSAFSVGGDITVNKYATLSLNGIALTEVAAAGGTTGGLNGSGAVRNYGAATTLTLNTANGNGYFTGNIYNSATSNAISVTIIGGGTQVFAGNQASYYTGNTTITGDGSTLQLGDGTTDGAISVSNITNNGSLVYNVVGSQTTGGVISGSGSITKSGTGTEILSGSNTYTGATTINGGTLWIGNGGTTGSLSASSAIINNGSLGLNRSNAMVQGVDFATTISGTGGIMSLGKGGVTLGDRNTYTGVTSINNGVINASTIVVAGGSSSLGNATSAVLLGGATNSGTLSYTGNSTTYTRGFTVSLNGGEFDTATAGQTTTITSGVTVASGGVFTIGGAGNTVVTSTISGAGGFRWANSGTFSITNQVAYTGATYVQGGGKMINATGTGAALAATGALTLGGADNSTGSYDLNGFNQSVAGLGTLGTGGTANVLTNNGASNAVLTVTGGGTFGGLITDGAKAIALTMSGSGNTLTLTNTNTYTGVTNINAGTVALGATGSIASKVINTGTGAAFDVTAQASGTSNYVVGNGFTINDNGGTVKGNLMINAGGVVTLAVTGTANQYTATLNNNVTLNGGQLTIYRATVGTTAGMSYINGSFTMTSGTLAFGVTSGTNAGTDNRLNITGNANITGGSITIGSGGGLFMSGAVNNITGLASTFTGAVSLSATTNQTLLVDDGALSTNTQLTIRNFGAGTAIKTVGTTTGHTLTINSIQFGSAGYSYSVATGTVGGTSGLKLSSNMTTTATSSPVLATWGVTNATTSYSIDTNGYTLNLNSSTTGFAPANVNGSSAVNWYIQNTAALGSGTIAATMFDFSKAQQVNVGGNSSAPVVLLASASGANNLGLSTSGTIAASTLFQSNGYGSTLTSGRQIGRLGVGDGANAATLTLVGSSMTVAGDVTVNYGGNLDLGGLNLTQTGAIGGTTGGLNGSGSVYNSADTTMSTLTLNTSSGNGNFSGQITDGWGYLSTVAVTITGTGTQVFSNANTYSGPTIVQSGTLALGASGSIASAAINVAKGAAFDVSANTSFEVLSGQTLTNNGGVTGAVLVSGSLNGTGVITGNLTINGGGSLAIGGGSGAAPGIQTINGDLTLLDSSMLSLNLLTAASGVSLVAGTDYDQLAVSGSVTLGGVLNITLGRTLLATDTFMLILNSGNVALSGSFSGITINGTAVLFANNLFNYNGQEYALIATDANSSGVANDLELLAIPEPGTWAMLGVGVGLFVMIQRSRRLRYR